MKIDVYADVACPWCYVGEKRLEKALLARPEVAGTVQRRWRPFQLRPEMPEMGLPWEPFARDKFGGEAGMRAAFEHVASAGAPDGVEFRFDRVASAPNTSDAHRLILFARDRGREWEMVEALFAAYFVQGIDLNDRKQLALLAAEARLDASEAQAWLSDDAGRAEVWRSQEVAARLGVSGVPFYVFDGRYAVSGAQPVGVFARAIDAALADETA